ncbi:MAG: hypothetical protein R3B60_02340 [Candidatus Paceibacterota bacterium]
MPENQLGTSFIPKRNPKKAVKRNAPRPVFIGTIIVRIFFFSILIAALAVFTFERKLQNDYAEEVRALDSAISSFNVESWESVLEIDTRLYQAKQRLQNTVSVTSIFDAIEAATIRTVTIENFDLERVDNSTVTIKSEMTTDSFDSVLFQREVLKANDKLSVDGVNELALNNAASENNVAGNRTSVQFKAELSVDPAKVPHIPPAERNGLNNTETATPAVVEDVVPINESESVETNNDQSNQNGL